MDRERPWCVVRRAGEGGGYALRFGCDDTEEFLELVRALKRAVDWHDRRFDPHEKWWTIAPRAWRELGGWLEDCVDEDQRRFAGVDPEELFDAARHYRAPPPPPRPSAAPGPGGPYEVLWLRPGAPPALVKAAYRTLAGLYHPDHGGDTESMRRLNLAYEQLGKGAA